MAEYRVEEDLYHRRYEYMLQVYNKDFDLWLTLSAKRYKSKDEAEVALNKLVKSEAPPKGKRMKNKK